VSAQDLLPVSVKAEDSMLWWIEEPLLIGSHNPDDSELAGIIESGVATVISLVDETEQKALYGDSHFADGTCVRHSIPIPDYGVPSAEQVSSFLEAVRDGLERGLVLVHCQGGSGRTGTLGALWLINRGMTPEEAIRAVRGRNSSAIETVDQEAFLFGSGRTPAGLS
jgi:ADP-ribosyl-[dinitrogen reductase] hydrolase